MSTHIDEDGNVMMVDVSAKGVTDRTALAEGVITMSQEAMLSITEHRTAKGDVLTVAQLAGIMGAKQTSSLIPLCHPLPLTNVKVETAQEGNRLLVSCLAKTSNQTGVEMEALTGVSIALLTVYDMLKGIDKSMVISDIRLVKKTGGKSGDYQRKQ